MHFLYLTYKYSIITLLLLGSTVVCADLITFHFTGRLTVLNANGDFVPDFIAPGTTTTFFDPYGLQSPIESIFTYNTDSGFGSSDLVISPFTFFGSETELSNISLQKIDNQYVLGNLLASFGSTDGIPISLVWDATGLFNAIDFGLQADDVISGTLLKRNGVTIYDVFSATPSTDGLEYNSNLGNEGYIINQGPAPLATTNLNTTTLCTPGVDCMFNALSAGIGYDDDGIAGSPLVDGPFPGMQISLDIGSGNSLTVLSVSSVPLPAAVWLFGSGLVVLAGFSKRKL